MASFNNPDTRTLNCHEAFRSNDGVKAIDSNTEIPSLYEFSSPQNIPTLKLQGVASVTEANLKHVTERMGEATPSQGQIRAKGEFQLPRPTPSPPKTAFMCFSLWLKANSKVEKTDLESLAKKYKSLPLYQKEKWEEEARKDKARYTAEKSGHKGPWQMPKRRAKKHPLAPKRPMSAFLRFSKNHRGKVKRDNPDVDNTDISRILGHIWNNLSEHEKEPYVSQELRERAIYKADTAQWKWKLMLKNKEMDETLNYTNFSASSYGRRLHYEEVPIAPTHIDHQHEAPQVQYAELNDYRRPHRHHYEHPMEQSHYARDRARGSDDGISMDQNYYTAERARDYDDRSLYDDHRYREVIQCHDGHNRFPDDNSSYGNQNNFDHKYLPHHGSMPNATHGYYEPTHRGGGYENEFDTRRHSE